MEKFERDTTSELDNLARVREQIRNVGTWMEQEHQRVPGNPWLALLNTRLGVVAGNLDGAFRKRVIDEVTYEGAYEKIDALKRTINQMRDSNSDDYLPPEDVREELLTQFRNIFS